MTKGGVRKHRSEQEWRELVREQADSGLSVLAWCHKRRVCQSAFYRWRARCGQARAGQAKASFVSVQVLPEEASGIEIVLGSGRRIRLTGLIDRQQLAEVVSVLEGSAC
jgi:hypothetical protein